MISITRNTKMRLHPTYINNARTYAGYANLFCMLRIILQTWDAKERFICYDSSTFLFCS